MAKNSHFFPFFQKNIPFLPILFYWSKNLKKTSQYFIQFLSAFNMSPLLALLHLWPGTRSIWPRVLKCVLTWHRTWPNHVTCVKISAWLWTITCMHNYFTLGLWKVLNGFLWALFLQKFIRPIPLKLTVIMFFKKSSSIEFHFYFILNFGAPRCASAGEKNNF